MSLSSKYNKDCGCDSPTASPKQYGSSPCAPSVQSPPSPCCESHKILYKSGLCLYASCTVVAQEEFFIGFSNAECNLPVDGNRIFFYHAGAGMLRVVGLDNDNYYKVRLEEPTNAGTKIEKGDCILLHVRDLSSGSGGSLFSRCLTGIFTAPDEGESQTIYIENGTSIPLGSTLTFTANGETGSYVVSDYVSSSSNIYAYSITNSGNGHLPGTIINGGSSGECLVPIEIISDLDFCDLSTTSTVDKLTGCLNGSPRSLISSNANAILKGNGAGGWTEGQLIATDCCVVTQGVLKFSGNTCPDGTDIVTLAPTGIACFAALWAEVAANKTLNGKFGQTKLPVLIGDFPAIVTAYNAGTRVATIKPVGSVSGLVEFPIGTQICVGEGCESCLKGAIFTSPVNIGAGGDPRASALFTYNTTAVLTWEAGVKRRYLVGFNTSPGLVTVATPLDASYNVPQARPRPLITDPLLARNKFCNISKNGCDQIVEYRANFELGFHPVPAGVRVHSEIGHLAEGAKFLADGSTPNPFFSVGTQTSYAGYIDGPTTLDAGSIIGNTNIGIGAVAGPKILPYQAGNLVDYIYLERCNCALGILWHYVEVEVLPGSGLTGTGVFNHTLRLRQNFIHHNANETDVVINNPADPGFNA